MSTYNKTLEEMSNPPTEKPQAQISCLSLDCPERTGGKCNVRERGAKQEAEGWQRQFVKTFYVYNLLTKTPAGAEKEAVAFFENLLSHTRKEAHEEAYEAGYRDGYDFGEHKGKEAVEQEKVKILSLIETEGYEVAKWYLQEVDCQKCRPNAKDGKTVPICEEHEKQEAEGWKIKFEKEIGGGINGNPLYKKQIEDFISETRKEAVEELKRRIAEIIVSTDWEHESSKGVDALSSLTK